MDAEGEVRTNAQAKGPVLDKPSKRETNTDEAIRKENLSGKQTKALKNFFKRLSSLKGEKHGKENAVV